jgi:sulfate adenylyltransferase subunit 1 (EFTu-like GTPase family)
MQKSVQRTKPELHSLAAINGGNVVEKSADMPWYDKQF